ncbi:Asp23/Gls24 family envelope stress response protein [Streptomyces sp. NPDC054958]
MTDPHRENIHRTAARTALGAPGVAALQPSLADRLALAAFPTHQADEAAGIRCEPTPDGGWNVEVRCVLHADRRVVDVARQVREDVRTAVTAYLTQHGTAVPVTVVVTVTRTV